MAKIAFLFPGQGAQKVGMGKDFAESSPAAARVFEQAADILGWDVRRLCFEDAESELDRTALSQPAILTTSLAIHAAMEEAGAPDIAQSGAAAGLSLGEYTALVAAGALAFPDALRLVEKRGRFMEDACSQNPGKMVSVLGLEDGIVEAICAQAREQAMVVTANYNCPGQLVISGSGPGVERACELARERNAKRLIPLAVSGAFHSPLMEPAAERLENALQETPLQPARIPVIANVSGGPVQEPDEIRNALVRQLKSPVRWTQSVRRLIDDGFDRFIELGPGKVLTGLMKRISPEHKVANISTLARLRKHLEN